MTPAHPVAEPAVQRAELLAGLLSTLPAPAAAAARGAVMAALDEALTSPSQAEASVRLSASGARCGRVMIERVGAELFFAACAALEVTPPPVALRLIDACRHEGLPLIAGWDTGPPRCWVKLYANASDASRSSRNRLAEQLGAPLAGAPLAPHVIGLNLGTGAMEAKLYVQAEPGRAALPSHHDAALDWERRAMALGAAAGNVVSWDLAGPPRPRAFFIATRRHAEGAVARLLDEIPGWSADTARALPFPPGPARSIGVSLAGEPSWTVYFKPRGAQLPVALLEPTLRCRAGAVEVGVFVEPDPDAPRAFLRTARHAISYRAAEGVADGPDVDILMRWVGARVLQAEAAGGPVGAALGSPPPPWRLVE